MRASRVARWLLLTATSAILAAAVVAGIDFESRACFLGVCGSSDFRSARLRLNAAASHMRSSWRVYRDAEALATAFRVLPATPRAGDPYVWFGPEVRDTARASVTHAVRRARSAYGAPGGRAPVALIIVVDTARRVDGVEAPWRAASAYSTRVIWPSPATHGWCVSYVTLGVIGARTGIGTAAGRPLLDACSYYDAFGMPSARVAAALDSGLHAAARLYRPGLPDSVRSMVTGGYTRYEAADLATYLCTRGSDSACAASFESVVSRAPGSSNSQVAARARYPALGVSSELAPTDAYWGQVFDRLEERLGREQFGALWARRVPPGASYVAAAGPPAIAVARADANARMNGLRESSRFGTEVALGDAAVAGDAILAALTVLLLLGVTMRFARAPNNY